MGIGGPISAWRESKAAVNLNIHEVSTKTCLRDQRKSIVIKEKNKKQTSTNNEGKYGWVEDKRIWMKFLETAHLQADCFWMNI